MRFAKDENSYFIVMNFGAKTASADFFHAIGVDQGRVICHVKGASARPDVLGEDDVVNLSDLSLAPGEGMVLRLF